MNESDNNSKFKNKAVIFFIIIGAVIIFFFIENLINWIYKISNQDELSLLLIPFHNNFFAFAKYFFTSYAFSGEAASSSSGVLRFIHLFIIGFVVFAVLSVISVLIPVLKKYSGKITFSLFFTVLILSFLSAFFFPTRKSVIDFELKEIALTKYQYYFIPSTEHISFTAIKNFNYTFSYVYDSEASFKKYYTYYMLIIAQLIEGREIRLGEIEMKEKQVSWNKSDGYKPSAETKILGEKIISLLNQKTGKTN